MVKESNAKEIDKYIDRLDSKTSTMKFLGTILLMVTALNLLLSMFLWITNFFLFRHMGPMIGFIGFIPFFLVVLLAYRFDQMRREGETLFEVISDELHAKSMNDYPVNNCEKSENISIKAKYILREFSRNSDLPLIPGRSGPAILCLVNFIFVFVNTFYFVRYI